MVTRRQVMRLVPMTLFLSTAIVVRNLAVIDAFEQRQADNARRRAMGLAPRTRRRRRTTLSELAVTSETHHRSRRGFPRQ